MAANTQSRFDKVNRALFISAVAIFVLVVALLLWACIATAANRASVRDDLPEMYDTPIIDYAATGVWTGSSSSDADMSFDERCEKSECTRLARYLGHSKSFMIEPVGGGSPEFFTDLYFEALSPDDERMLTAGNARSVPARDGLLTVRERGGSGELVTSTSDGFVDPTVGALYLLFLYSVSDGSAYNTEGDHFYVLGGKDGVLEYRYTDTFIAPSGDEAVNIEGAVQACAIARENGPANAGANSRASYIADIERRYQNGELSQEYYDNAMAYDHAVTTNFARILDEDEQRAVEEKMARDSGFAGHGVSQ